MPINEPQDIGKVFKFDLKQEGLYFGLHNDAIWVDDKFQLKYKSSSSKDKIIFNLVDKTYEVHGSFNDRTKDGDLWFHATKSHHFFYDTFINKVNMACKSNPEFKQAVQETCLFKLMEGHKVSAMRALLLYCQEPAIYPLLQSDFWFEKLQHELGKTHEIWNPNAILKQLDLEGKTLPELFKTTQGVLNQIERYEHLRFEELAQRIKWFDMTLRPYCEDGEYFEKYVKPLLKAWWEHSFMSLNFLLNSGYSPKELYGYLRKCQDKQAIEIADGLYYLSYIVNHREIYQGKRTPIFPLNLLADFKVMLRATFRSKDEIKGLFIENILNKRKTLEFETKEFNLFTYRANGIDDTTICDFAFRDCDIIYFKKINGNTQFPILIKHDAILFNQKEINEKYFKEIEAWATRNKLMVMLSHRKQFEEYGKRYND